MKCLAFSALADVAVIVVFVAIGREEHNSGSSIVGLLETAAPFLIALAIGWLATRAWHNPAGVGRGLGIWLVTILAGMNLRHYVFDDGTATPSSSEATRGRNTLNIGSCVAIGYSPLL